MNKPLAIVLFGVALLLTAAGCRPKKKLVNLDAGIYNLHAQEITDSVESHLFIFRTFSSRVSTEVSSPGFDKSFRTNLRIGADSVIWMSLSIANIVGAGALITTDSVTVIDRMAKEYFSGDFNYLNSLFGTEFDYDVLQDLIVGNPIYFDPSEKYKTARDSTYYFLSTVGKRKLRRAFEKEKRLRKDTYICRYWFYPGIFRPAKVVINDLSDSTSLQVEYLSYEQLDSVPPVPSKVKITATSPGKKAEINLNYSRTRVNDALEFPFKIPEGYEKME